ncbi:hypothetical protein [uncultured Methanobrevibacter sp.]|nr:hypothetical protein [uncultured Methanobrevibacter sp.]
MLVIQCAKIQYAMDELYIKVLYALGTYLNYEINKVINDNEKI